VGENFILPKDLFPIKETTMLSSKTLERLGEGLKTIVQFTLAAIGGFSSAFLVSLFIAGAQLKIGGERMSEAFNIGTLIVGTAVLGLLFTTAIFHFMRNG